jgi:hypothetical protein
MEGSVWMNHGEVGYENLKKVNFLQWCPTGSFCENNNEIVSPLHGITLLGGKL